MRDLFYTVVVAWLVYKIWQAFSAPSYKNRHTKKEGDVSIKYKSPSASNNDDKGEYVDYEEVKD